LENCQLFLRNIFEVTVQLWSALWANHAGMNEHIMLTMSGIPLKPQTEAAKQRIACFAGDLWLV